MTTPGLRWTVGGKDNLLVNTVNCLPVCRALEARKQARKVRSITTDLFAEMTPYFQRGTISASIYRPLPRRRQRRAHHRARRRFAEHRDRHGFASRVC
jgi:hypothetical protein